MIISKSKIISIILSAFAAGTLLTFLVVSLLGGAGDGVSAGAKDGDGHSAADHAEGDVYYTCPMHPSVISDSPGACPVCHMDLIKKSANAGELSPSELAAAGQVALSPSQRVLANVQTTAARARDSGLAAEGASDAANAPVRAAGVVAADEAGLASVPSWLDGRIERLLVKKVGAKISRGQPIMEIYSPDLLTAQNEFLIALKNADQMPQSGENPVVESMRQRLRLLGMSQSQVSQVEKTRQPQQTVTMRAPNPGTITNLLVRQGQYVQTGTPLFEVADLSEIRVEAQLREQALAQIETGAPVGVVSDAWRGETLPAKVDFIYPTMQSDTRTVKVRIKLDKPDPRLRPGMYVTVLIEKNAAPGPAADGADTVPGIVLVPRSAVLRGGKSDHLFVEVSENVFERRPVAVVEAGRAYFGVRGDLKVGESVAVSGAFLLDSEVQLHSFGGGDHGHGDAHAGHDAHAEHAGGEDGGHAMLTHAAVPAEGREFKPPIPVSTIPEDMWFCDMGSKAHWVQHEKGDGKCPLCGMFLVQHPQSEPDAKTASDSARTPAGAKKEVK